MDDKTEPKIIPVAVIKQSLEEYRSGVIALDAEINRKKMDLAELKRNRHQTAGAVIALTRLEKLAAVAETATDEPATSKKDSAKPPGK